MIDLYTKTVCGYCVAAKELLNLNEIPFNEINIEKDDNAREFLKSNGHKTVPQLYYDGRLLVTGGYTGLKNTDLAKLRVSLGLD